MSAENIDVRLQEEYGRCVALAGGTGNSVVAERERRLAAVLGEAASEIVRLRGEVAMEQESSKHWFKVAMKKGAEARRATIAPAEAKGDVLRELFAKGDSVHPNYEAYWDVTPQPADGGAVAWQERNCLINGVWGGWYEVSQAAHDESVANKTAKYQVRALYTHPPAAQVQQEAVEPMTGDLLPCPFCGKSNQDRWPCEWLDGSGANVIRCAWCHGAAPMNTWNRRTARPSACELGAWPPAGCIVVEEASCVPHVHPEYGVGLFFTEDAALQHRGDSQEVGRGTAQ